MDLLRAALVSRDDAGGDAVTRPRDAALWLQIAVVGWWRGVTDRPAREPSQHSLGSNLLLGGLFFPERINGKPAEIGSIEHLPNPALSSFHLSIHLSN